MLAKVMVNSCVELDAVTDAVVDATERLNALGLIGFSMSVTGDRIPHGHGDVRVTCTTVTISGGPDPDQISQSPEAADAMTLLWAVIGRITAGTLFHVDSIHRDALIRRAAIEARLNGYTRRDYDAADVVSSFSDGPGLVRSRAERLHTGDDYSDTPHEIDDHDVRAAVDYIRGTGCKALRFVWLRPDDAVRVAALAIEWAIRMSGSDR